MGGMTLGGEAKRRRAKSHKVVEKSITGARGGG